MFREMRRKRQLLSEEASSRILFGQTSGVLAVEGDDGYPYAVPLSYVYDGKALYFHCAKAGHKLDAIRRNPKASFCVIAQDEIVPEEYTTYFRSVIAFGKVTFIEEPDEKRRALRILAEKYSAEFLEGAEKEIEDKLSAVCIFCLEIEHLSGKEAIEFAEAR